MADNGDMATVRIIFGKVRPESLLASLDAHHAPSQWIPRVVIHPEDSAALEGMFTGQRMNLRMSRSKALEIGFLTERDPNTPDMFQAPA